MEIFVKSLKTFLWTNILKNNNISPSCGGISAERYCGGELYFDFIFLLRHAVWAVVLILEAYCILYIQAKKNIYYARLRIGVNHHSHLGMR